MKIDWAENIEIAVVSLFCVINGMLGTRMKWYSREDKEECPYDRRSYLSGLYLAAGAGLVTGLLGQGLHINKSFLMGASIVAGYAGGKRFFEWVQKMLSALTMKRLHKELREGGETLSEMMDGKDDEKDGDPP